MGSHQAFALGRLRAKYLVWREEAVCIGVCACVGVSGVKCRVLQMNYRESFGVGNSAW